MSHEGRCPTLVDADQEFDGYDQVLSYHQEEEELCEFPADVVYLQVSSAVVLLIALDKETAVAPVSEV